MFFIDVGMSKAFVQQQVTVNDVDPSSWRRLFALFNKNILITLSLTVVLSACIFSAVYAVHINRELYSQLEIIQEKRDFYQAEWSQLLLEQSALSAQGRVEQIAREDLAMVAPRTEDTIQIRK